MVAVNRRLSLQTF